MLHSNARLRSRQIDFLRTQFAQADSLPFADVLPAERIQRALQEEGADWRHEVFSPALTLWTFLSQVVSADGSCRAAVARVLAWLVAHDEVPCSPKTDPYCKARQRLPESFLHRLVRETGKTLHDQTPRHWRWQGRLVKIADGTTLTLPDTPTNQAEYPQPSTQKVGLGFPLMRMVTVFSLAAGAVVDAALGPYSGKQQGENSLLRTLESVFDPGDVLLVDRYYSGYFDIAWWLTRRVDVVTRLHQMRHCDMRRGQRLGHDDHLVTWSKPRQRPEWMDEETYAGMPAELTLREVRIHVRIPGCRTKTLVIVTTLTNASRYSASDLAELYRQRWEAELHLRSLKTTLGMDMLRCKSPEMVRKEVWAHLVAYNLIRTVMAQAAKTYDLKPREISFKGAVQTVLAFAERLLEANGQITLDLGEWLLIAVASHRVGNRPNRLEPRARKRRPKYDFLTKPRSVARKQLQRTG